MYVSIKQSEIPIRCFFRFSYRFVVVVVNDDDDDDDDDYDNDHVAIIPFRIFPTIQNWKGAQQNKNMKLKIALYVQE